MMKDGSVIMKKANGESMILNPDDSVNVLDKDGEVKGREDFRFKLS